MFQQLIECDICHTAKNVGYDNEDPIRGLMPEGWFPFMAPLGPGTENKHLCKECVAAVVGRVGGCDYETVRSEDGKTVHAVVEKGGGDPLLDDLQKFYKVVENSGIPMDCIRPRGDIQRVFMKLAEDRRTAPGDAENAHATTEWTGRIGAGMKDPDVLSGKIPIMSSGGLAFWIHCAGCRKYGYVQVQGDKHTRCCGILVENLLVP